MADLTFRFGETGADKLAAGMRKVSDAEVLAARGARLAADAIEKQRKAAGISAGATLALASADDILKEAEHGLAEGALEAEFALKREADAEKQAARDALEAAAANKALADSYGKIADKAGGFSLKGTGLALSPALIPLAGGVAAGVGAIGVSFGAAAIGAGLFAKAATSVLSGASSNLKKLQTLEVAANSARTAAGRKAALQQIADLKATWSAGYLDMLDSLEKFQAKWTSVSQAIAVPALTSWIHVLTDAIGFLKPAVAPVAAVFTQWGQTLDRYFKSAAGSAEVTRLAAAFGRFSASQLRDIGVFVVDIGKGIFSLARDLAGHNVDFGTFGKHLAEWGAAFARWSQSAAARQDVNKFLAYLHANGPAVSGLLKNLGGVLKAFAPGLSSVGSLELRLVSDFLGVLAKTPKSVAKPLVDVAGALLLLQKTGVLKVGIKLVGTAAKLLSGGAIDIGGGAAAAGEIRAAFASGGAAAAAEIRAALAGGGAAGGAGGIGGGAAAGATAGKAAGGGFLTALRAALTPAAGGVIAGALIRAAGDTLSPAGTFAGKLNKNFQDDGHLWSSTLLHSFTFGGLEAWLTTKIGLPVGKALDNVGSFVHGSWTKTENDTKGIWGNISGFLSGSWHKLVGDSGTSTGKIRGNFSGMSDTILGAMRRAGQASDAFRTRNLVPLLGEAGKVSGGIQGLSGMITGRLNPGINSGGQHADAFRTRNLTPLRGELGKDSGGVQGLQTAIGRLKGKTVNVGVHASGSGGMTFTQKVAASISSGGFSLRSLASGGRITTGTGPTADDVPILASRGETVVSAAHSKMLAPAFKAAGVPGYASGGIAGTVPWAGGAEYNFARSAESALLRAEYAQLKKAVAAAAKAAAATAAVGALGGPTSASAAQAQAYARSRLGAYGWGAAQMTPLIRLWNQESGWNRLARNPSSGAYGIPQALPASKMGAAANPPASSAAAQINWGLGYIRGRYGSPAGAWGHEVAYNWYDKGGMLKPGLTLAYNGTGRPEQVVPAGGAAGSGGVHLHLTVNGPIGSQQQLEDWYVRTANKLAQHGRLTQAVKTASR